MMETIAVAVVAAIGAYIGSSSAFSRVYPRAADATAQAYRDILAALCEYRSACLDMTTANDMEQEPTDAMRATFSRAANAVNRIAHSASFLFLAADFDLIDTVMQVHYSVGFRERMEDADKALDGLRKSARELFGKASR
jgi:hypothetical protein